MKPGDKALLVDRIEKLFLGDTGDCLNTDHAKKDFHVMLRIAVDFHEFLVATDTQEPDAQEVEYVVDTIRSGIDFFFNFNHFYRLWADQPCDESPRSVPANFALLKSEYLRVFQKMTNEKMSFKDRMRCLFLLVGMELQFIAAWWPIPSI